MIKTTAPLLLIFLMALLSPACKNNDPDPRTAFVGSFEMDTFQVILSQQNGDSVFTISGKPEITFAVAENFENNALEAEFDGFIDDVMQQSMALLINSSAQLAIAVTDEQMIEVKGNAYQTNEIDFTATLIENEVSSDFSCEFAAEGDLVSGELTVDFEIIFFTGGSNVTFTGTAAGSRE